MKKIIKLVVTISLMAVITLSKGSMVKADEQTDLMEQLRQMQLNSMQNLQQQMQAVQGLQATQLVYAPSAPVAYLMINTGTEQVIAFDANNVPIRVFSCSTGKSGNTYLGTYTTTNYYEWQLMNGNCYSRYAVRFNTHELMHSVPYYRRDPSSLEYNQYNKLGTPASAGCCRLALIDAKWIYENTIPGTIVQVVKEPDLVFPLTRPNIILDTNNKALRGWDPTDTFTPGSPYYVGL